MTNDATRATAQALPECDRRSLLRGMVAVSAAGGATLLAATVTAHAASITQEDALEAVSPDAALLQLDKEMRAIHARMNRAYRRCSQIAAEVDKAVGIQPPHPMDWKTPAMPSDISEMHDKALQQVKFSEFTKYDEWQPSPVRAWYQRIEEKKGRTKAAWDKFLKQKKEQYRLHGYEAAEVAANTLNNNLWQIGRRIFATPASTFEGLMVKIQAGDRLGLDDFADINEAFLSITKDIKRLSKRAKGVRRA